MAKIKKIGVQLYTIREFMNTEEEIRESFKKLKAIGYDQAQTAGCKISYEAFGKIAKEEGIEIVGTHDDYDLMVNDFEEAYRRHELLGTKIMGIGGYFGNAKNCNAFDEFVTNANIIGEKIAARGGKFTYHNHHREFLKMPDGRTIMDFLADNLNPETTSFVLDTHWVQRGGGDVCAWIQKLSGRIDILHLKDFKVYRTEDFDILPDYAEIGNGNLNWEKIMEEAAKAGVKAYVVEQDTCPGDPFDSLKMSSEFIHKNFM